MKIQDITEGYGRYYCSTDKKWKTRKGPKQTRKVSESYLKENASKLLSAEDRNGVITVIVQAPDGTKRSLADANPRYINKWLMKYDLTLPRNIMSKFVESVEQGVAEGWKEKVGAAALAGAVATGAGANTPKVPLDKAIQQATAVYNINKAVRKHKEKEAEKRKSDKKQVKEQDVAEGSLEEYGDTAKGQKMLTKVQKRAVDRVVSKKADTDPKYAKKNSDTAKRAWDRMTDLEETYDGDEFFEAYGELWYNEDEQLDEAEYQGRSVPLGKPMQGDVKKFKVYVKDPSTGNVKKVNFGDPDMKIKKSNPARRRSFRARHNCDNPGPRTKARYWSCRKW